MIVLNNSLLWQSLLVQGALQYWTSHLVWTKEFCCTVSMPWCKFVKLKEKLHVTNTISPATDGDCVGEINNNSHMNMEAPLYLFTSCLSCLYMDWFICVLLTWAIKKEQGGEGGHKMLPNHSWGECINDTGSDASRPQQPKSKIQCGDI